MTAAKRPAKRLLVVPAALLAAVLAVVIAVPGITGREPDPALEVGGLPPVAADLERACRRDGSATGTGQIPRVRGARVSAAAVAACPDAFDGLTVTYAGELIGDLLRRDGGAWVQVNDDPYALRHGPLPAHDQHAGTNSSLSVWLPDALLGEVTGLGRHGRRGDVVLVEGTIRRTDPEDGGGLTLRAERMDVLRPSEPAAEPFDAARAALAAASLLAAGLLTAARRRAARR